MALDASIYGQLDTQAPLRLSQMLMQNADPMAQAQKVLTLKAMLGQGKMQDMQMRSAQADAEETANLRRLLSDPSFNRSAPDASARVMAVAPVKGASILDAWQKGDVAQSTIAENRAKAADFEQKNKLALLDHMSNVAGTMKDQKSYERGAMYLASLSPFLNQQVQQWPTQHDPSFVSQLAQQSISAKDQVAQALQQRNVESEIANRLATQQTARGNLDVAKGNLGVSMQRLNLEAENQKQGRIPPGYQVQQDGSLKAWQGGPADQKAQVSEVGKQTVSEVVSSMRDIYNQLDAKGGITNTEKTGLENLARGGASSTVGQAVGKALGTENQSLRNTVAQQRPLLLQAIMRATGMSSKQMDTNNELQMYLAAATDPKLDVQANKRALDMLEKLYGKGSDASSPPATPQRATLQQITETARRYGKTVDEVIRDARAKGIQVQ